MPRGTRVAAHVQLSKLHGKPAPGGVTGAPRNQQRRRGVDELSSPASQAGREDRVRALGIDPRYLSPEEQAEVIEIHAACPDEQLDTQMRMEM
jgi:hypothetical protein